MDEFTNRTMPLVGQIERHMERGFDALLKLLALQTGDLSEEDIDSVNSLSESLDAMYSGLDDADEGMRVFEEGAIGLPKLSLKFNKSRRRVLKFIDDYRQMTIGVRSTIENTHRTLDAYLPPN